MPLLHGNRNGIAGDTSCRDDERHDSAGSHILWDDRVNLPESARGPQSPAQCADFVAKLETCTPYKCTFVHPFTGERMEKRIVEYKARKCKYTEQMPNGGKMECAYTDTIRKAIVKSHKDLEAANSTGKSVDTSVHITLREAKTRYTIDGKEVESPAQEALDNGQCKISGYTNSPPKKN